MERTDRTDGQLGRSIRDMNQPLPDRLKSSYTAVIDGGCLEPIKRIAPAFVTDLHRRARDRRAAKPFNSDHFRIIK